MTRQEKQKIFSREYYAKKKDDPEFKRRHRETQARWSRNHPDYHRKYYLENVDNYRAYYQKNKKKLNDYAVEKYWEDVAREVGVDAAELRRTASQRRRQANEEARLLQQSQERP